MKLKKLIPLTLVLVCQGVIAGDLYVVGDVTHSKDSLKTSAFNSALSGAGATGLSTSDSGSGNQWRLQLGYGLNSYLAIEGGYIDFGKAKYSATYSGGSAAGELKAGGADVVAVGKLPLSDNFYLFGKAGVVALKAESSLIASTPATAANEKSTSNEVRPLVGLGASYKITDNIDLRAEYDHVSGIGENNKIGTMDSNMISMGVAYHF
ncbi:MAG: outer membrane beta-barrel protein [Thiobacillaceae bacterium]